MGIFSGDEAKRWLASIEIAVLEQKLIACSCLRYELTVLFSFAFVAATEAETLVEMGIGKLLLAFDACLIDERHFLSLLLICFGDFCCPLAFVLFLLAFIQQKSSSGVDIFRTVYFYRVTAFCFFGTEIGAKICVS